MEDNNDENIEEEVEGEEEKEEEPEEEEEKEESGSRSKRNKEKRTTMMNQIHRDCYMKEWGKISKSLHERSPRFLDRGKTQDYAEIAAFNTL